ncbi:MAG: 30S ribosomal protein S2 [Mycoplasmoidaceae bacterium]|nr:MAG: 30S ribosomal protein S2 [Mycoplasmoidaceae bacterium]
MAIKKEQKNEISSKEINDINAFIEKVCAQAQVPHLVSSEKLIEYGAQNLMIGKKWNDLNKHALSKEAVKKYRYFDLKRTFYGIVNAYKKIQDSVKNNEDIMFVATKNAEISAFVKQQCEVNGLFYVTKRWLGGILTNFKTVKASINKLNKLIALQDSGEIKKYNKKEQAQLIKEYEKLNNFIGGVRTMVRPPKLLVILDSVVENIAIKEAKKINASIIALSNSNANPKDIDYNIPCNTMSKKTNWLILSILFDAVAQIKGNNINVIGKKDNEIVCPYNTSSATEKKSIISKSR